MSDNSNPKGLAALQTQRAKLIVEQNVANARIARMNKSDPKREQLVKKVQELTGQIVDLKRQIKEHAEREADEFRKWGVVENGHSQRHEFAKSFEAFMDYVHFLEREVAELTVENRALKQEVETAKLHPHEF